MVYVRVCACVCACACACACVGVRVGLRVRVVWCVVVCSDAVCAVSRACRRHRYTVRWPLPRASCTPSAQRVTSRRSGSLLLKHDWSEQLHLSRRHRSDCRRCRSVSGCRAVSHCSCLSQRQGGVWVRRARYRSWKHNPHRQLRSQLGCSSWSPFERASRSG